MVRLDERTADSDIDGYAEDVSCVQGVGVWVLDFVGCYAGAGAVDGGEVVR